MNMMQMYQMLRSNPMQVLGNRFNIPQNLANDPNAIVQHLLNTGQISQGQINQVMAMKNNPMFQQMFNSKL